MDAYKIVYKFGRFFAKATMGNCQTSDISVEDRRDILHILIEKNEEIKQLRFQNERLKSELNQVVPLGLRIRIPQQPAKPPTQDSSTQTE